jgi:hypothetical protein
MPHSLLLVDTIASVSRRRGSDTGDDDDAAGAPVLEPSG